MPRAQPQGKSVLRQDQHERFVFSVWAVLAVWAIFAAIRLLLQPLIGWHPPGADEWTRALEVRALLDGQAWWDVSQYRMNPPDGFSMHWSRLVDLPLAGGSLLLGEGLAFALVPLAWLLTALFALRSIMLRLTFSPLAMGFGLCLLPLFPLLPGTFAPFAIDHHAPQAVLGLVCGALLLSDRRGAAIAGGVCAAAWVAISLEGLPLVAALAGLYGLRYFWAEQRLLAPFLCSLAITAPAFTWATRGPAAFAQGFCDILLPGHMAAFGVAAAGALLLPARCDVRLRAGALALIAAASLGVGVPLLGACATNPMAELDPLLIAYWHGYITEGLPVWRQPISAGLVLVWTIALIGAGWWAAGRSGAFNNGRAQCWTLLAGFALAAGLYSLLLYRAGVLAQLLAIPFAALLLAHWLPKARALTAAVPRIIATLACFAFATPVFVSAAAKPLDPLTQPELPVEGEACDYARLAEVEPGLIFAPMDNAPEILARTRHDVVAASYHRNQGPMRAVIGGFTAPLVEAEAIVRGTGADYVLACSSEADVALYRTAARGNFANALVTGAAPEWLEPVAGFSEGSLRLYRIKPGGKPSPHR
jgi:hypothetical protein